MTLQLFISPLRQILQLLVHFLAQNLLCELFLAFELAHTNAQGLQFHDGLKFVRV